MSKKKGTKGAAEQRIATGARQSAWDRLFDSPYYFLYYCAAIGILTVILFSKFIFSDMMLFGSDTLLAGVFFREFFVEYFKAHGAVPPWNPFIFGGLPFVDAFHGDIFYPISFAFKMVFPLFRALGWVLVFHVFLAGVAMYLCVRAFKLGRLAASIAGIFYMFAPYLVSLVAPGHDGKMFVTALFPFAMMFLERGMEKRTYLDFVGLGVIIGLIILTPHPQMAYFALWGIGSYFLFKLITRYLKDRSSRTAALLCGFFVLAIVLGLALSAIQFYPGYKYVKDFSPRSGEGRGGYEWATSWSMHFEELIGTAVPLFAGVDNSDGRFYWGRNYFKDNSEYSGVIPLILAAIALVFAKDKRKWYLLGLGMLALTYALGGTTPLFRLFYYLVPNVKSMRAPAMIMFLFSFSSIILAAMCVEYLEGEFRSNKAERRRRLVKIMGVTAAVFGLLALLFTVSGEQMLRLYQGIFYSSITPEKQEVSFANLSTIQVSFWFAAVLMGLLALLLRGVSERKMATAALALIAAIGLVDVWRLDFKFIETIDPRERFAQHQSVDYLKPKIGYDRILDMTFRMFPSKDYYAYFGIYQVDGYHGNQLASYDRLIGGLKQSHLHDNYGIPQMPVLNLLGAKYLVYDSEYPMRDTTLLKVFDVNRIAIYMNRSALPRVFPVHDYMVVADPDSTVGIVADPRFDPRRLIILNEQPQFEPQSVEFWSNESCSIAEYEPGYVKLSVSLEKPGFVCLTDPHYPAWKASIDGAPTRIYQAYGALRSVGVPEGEHTIEFTYESELYNKSKVITYLSILFVLGSVALAYVYPRFLREKKDA
jgi:hypothetical protein